MNGSVHQLRQTQVHVSALMSNTVSVYLVSRLNDLTPSIQGYELQGTTKVPEAVNFPLVICQIH
jgi:hypothetical protein